MLTFARKKKKKGGQWVSHWLLLSQYVTLWWHPLSKASPSTNNVPFSFVTFCLIFSFIWRVIYYTSQKIIFITLKVSQSGPLSCSKTDTVPHVRWRVPLIFQARSNSVSVVCTCPILVIALIQMAPLYATAVPEQFFFFFFKQVCVVFSSVPLSPSAIIYHTAVFNFLPHDCLFYIALSLYLLPNALCYRSALWHPSLSVSTEHGIISISGFSPVFTNTPPLLLDTHTHARCTHVNAHGRPSLAWYHMRV